MTKGFNIEDILSGGSKKKSGLSNYHKNLSYHSFNPSELNMFCPDSNKGQGLCYKTSGISLPLPNNCSSLNKPSIISPHAKQPEGFRPSLGCHTPGWPQMSSTNHIPVHKKGQVEATRKSKPRKTQTVFSQQQLTVLEANYNNNNYISTDERNEIAQRLQMTVPQVKNWFQNKRNKERKMGHAPNRNSLHLTSSPYAAIGTARHMDLSRGVNGLPRY